MVFQSNRQKRNSISKSRNSMMETNFRKESFQKTPFEQRRSKSIYEDVKNRIYSILFIHLILVSRFDCDLCVEESEITTPGNTPRYRFQIKKIIPRNILSRKFIEIRTKRTLQLVRLSSGVCFFFAYKILIK